MSDARAHVESPRGGSICPDPWTRVLHANHRPVRCSRPFKIQETFVPFRISDFSTSSVWNARAARSRLLVHDPLYSRTFLVDYYSIKQQGHAYFNSARMLGFHLSFLKTERCLRLIDTVKNGSLKGSVLWPQDTDPHSPAPVGGVFQRRYFHRRCVAPTREIV